MGGSFQVEKHKIGKNVDEGITCTLAAQLWPKTSSTDLARACQKGGISGPTQPMESDTAYMLFVWCGPVYCWLKKHPILTLGIGQIGMKQIKMY